MTESLYSGCYAICPREVAAVRLGAGRRARHEIILRSGVRLPVPYAQATLLADRIWDGVWPAGAAQRPRKKCGASGRGPRRAAISASGGGGGGGGRSCNSNSHRSSIRQAIMQTLTKDKPSKR